MDSGYLGTLCFLAVFHGHEGIEMVLLERGDVYLSTLNEEPLTSLSLAVESAY